MYEKILRKIKNLENKLDNLELFFKTRMIDIESQWKIAIYQLESKIYNTCNIKKDYVGVDLSLPSLEDSPTDPHYDLFTDEDYDI